MNWLHFLRRYGTVLWNENMYDEAIDRSGSRQRIQSEKLMQKAIFPT